MNFSIRPYQPADIENCRSLWAELTEWHRKLYADATIGGENPGQAFDNYLTSPNLYQVWVADAGGQVVGFTGLLVNGYEGEIEPIIVSNAARSQGIGQSLIEHAIAEAKKRNIRYLSVRPVARNIKAIAFFVEMGFRLVGQIDLFQELSASSDREWIDGIQIHEHRLKC